jgi:hypothetical protein
MVLSSEYHRRQATTLAQLAQTTHNRYGQSAAADVAEHLVQADEALRVTEPTDKPGVGRRRDPS